MSSQTATRLQLGRNFPHQQIKKGILVFLMVCTLDKKLSRGLVRDKNFCPVSYHLICTISWLVSKSNRVKISCSVKSHVIFINYELNMINHIFKQCWPSKSKFLFWWWSGFESQPFNALFLPTKLNS